MQVSSIGFLGAGNMAEAIINGVISANLLPPDAISVYDISPERSARFVSKGVQVADSVVQLTENCHVIFLSVKPQNFADILPVISKNIQHTGVKVFTSIAAGVSTDYIRSFFSEPVPVIRAMPNTPLLLRQGATAICRTDRVADSDFAFVKQIFGACGLVVEMPESEMNAVIAVNGSSPAYIYLFTKAIVDYAAAQGIEEKTALQLFSQTLIGSAHMMLESGYKLPQLIEMVSSPGGTTLAALDVLYRSCFEGIIQEAAAACTHRAVELGK